MSDDFTTFNEIDYHRAEQQWRIENMLSQIELILDKLLDIKLALILNEPCPPHPNNLTRCEPLENTNRPSTSTMSDTPPQYFEPLLYISEFTNMLNDNETIEQVTHSFSNDPTATVSFRYIQTMTDIAERMERDLTDLQNE